MVAGPSLNPFRGFGSRLGVFTVRWLAQKGLGEWGDASRLDDFSFRGKPGRASGCGREFHLAESGFLRLDLGGLVLGGA